MRTLIELKILELLNSSSKNWYQIDRGLRARKIYLKDSLETILSNLQDDDLILKIDKFDPNSSYCLTEKGRKSARPI